ncbi:uncharacterized protein LOC144554206 isoform X1 [Carex rostrata]
MLNLGEWQAGDEPGLKKLIIKKCPKLWKITIPEKVEVFEVNGCGCQEIEFSSHSELKRLSISNCRKLITIYYKSGDLPFLESISLSACPKLLIFSAILEEMKQMDKRNSGFQSEIQNGSDYREFIPRSMGRVSLFNCPKLRIFSAIPAIELDTLEIINCGIHEIILPSRCKLLEIHNCPELISVHWRDGDSSSLPLVKFFDCPQLELLKIPKEVKVLQITSCGTHEIFFLSQSKVQSVDICGCLELFSVHWMDGDVPFLKDLFFEDCPKLISLQFLQGDLPLLEKFTIISCPQFHEVLTIPYQLKALKIVDCCFPEIHLLPQSNLRQLFIGECANLTAIKGLQGQFPTGDVSHTMMEMVLIYKCPRMDFGTHGNIYFYDQRVQRSNLEWLGYQ